MSQQTPQPGRSRRRLRRRAALTGGLAASLVLTPLPFASATPSTSAVISEVYGGGGNSGATLTRDFVELANASGTAYALGGHSVQYLPGSPSSGSQWQVTELGGEIAPGGRYLISEAQGNGGTVELPAPDAAGSIYMSASKGTVALVSGTEPLTCKTAEDCAADERIVDLVGYGSAVVHEGGGPVPGMSNTSSVARPGTPADTDDNAADLTAGAPTPVNSAGEGAGDGGDPDPDPEPDPEPGDVRIRDIQGTTRTSPLTGQTVTGVPGVVTGVAERGFWIQDPEPDTDPATSEGVYVYTGSTAPTVAMGDSVLVSGRITEYRPGSGSQTLTEISGPRVTVLSSGTGLPEPVALDASSVPDAYAPSPGGSIDDLPLAPETYALDLYEALEGMRVSFSDARAVSRTTDYDEIWVTVKPGENPSQRGGTVYGSYDTPNTGRLKVMDLAGALPSVNVGDEISGTTTGLMDYSRYGGYTVQATALGTATDHGLSRETTREQARRELAIATYNVENLSAADDDAKFAELADGIVSHLASPDIVALEEIQDNTGPANDGVVAADQTLEKFTAAIEAAGGPSYEWRAIDPEDGRDGGQPGGNIRVGFLFNPERVSFTDRPGGDATTAVEVVDTRRGAELSVSPGRINPTSEAWASSRKPLAGEFVFRGQTYFLIANHFASKGGDQSLHGSTQPPVRDSETQRHQQAAEVAGFVKELQAADPKARVVVLGDLNDFEFSETLSILTEDTGLTNLMLTLPEDERYTYVYDGNSQSLDNILVSESLRRVDYDVVHINAEFAEQASDHDPQIVRISRGGGGGHGHWPPHLDWLFDWLKDLLGRG